MIEQVYLGYMSAVSYEARAPADLTPDQDAVAAHADQGLDVDGAGSGMSPTILAGLVIARSSMCANSYMAQTQGVSG